MNENKYNAQGVPASKLSDKAPSGWVGTKLLLLLLLHLDGLKKLLSEAHAGLSCSAHVFVAG